MFFKLSTALLRTSRKDFLGSGGLASVPVSISGLSNIQVEPRRPKCYRSLSSLAWRLVYSGSRLIITRPASRSLSPRHFAPPRAKTRSHLVGRHALFRESPTARSDEPRSLWKPAESKIYESHRKVKLHFRPFPNFQLGDFAYTCDNKRNNADPTITIAFPTSLFISLSART